MSLGGPVGGEPGQGRVELADGERRPRRLTIEETPVAQGALGDSDQFDALSGGIGCRAGQQLRAQFSFHAAMDKPEISGSSTGLIRLAYSASASDKFGVMDKAELLRRRVQARLDATGLKPTPAAEKAGFNRDFITDILNGRKKSVSSDRLIALATVLGCSPEYLTNESYREPLTPSSNSGGRIAIVGYVGAASQYFEFDLFNGMEDPLEIDAPPGAPDDAQAVLVRGDFNYPAFRDGTVLVFWDRMADPSPVAGEECFVHLKDGRTLVKIIERGSAPGLWTLLSVNSASPPMRDIEIDWAAPIEIRLRKANWLERTAPQ